MKFDEIWLEFWMLSGAKACKSCRSRQELSIEYLIAKFGFDTAEKIVRSTAAAAAENEPLKVCQNPTARSSSPRWASASLASPTCARAVRWGPRTTPDGQVSTLLLPDQAQARAARWSREQAPGRPRRRPRSGLRHGIILCFYELRVRTEFLLSVIFFTDLLPFFFSIYFGTVF